LDQKSDKAGSKANDEIELTVEELSMVAGRIDDGTVSSGKPKKYGRA
jgi:hypothetical protein